MPVENGTLAASIRSTNAFRNANRVTMVRVFHVILFFEVAIATTACSIAGSNTTSSVIQEYGVVNT